MPAPSFTGSGGGLFGALRAALASQALFRGYFGDGSPTGDLRVRTGHANRDDPFPTLVLSHVGGRAQRHSDGLLTLPTVFQAGVFAEGYDAARALSVDLDGYLSGLRLAVDGVEVVVFLDTPGEAALTKMPERSESGQDVWQSPSRYRVELVRTGGK